MSRCNRRTSQDTYFRRPMNTIVELSVEQGRLSIDEHESEEAATSLTPFARETLTSVFSAITAVSKRTGATTVNLHETEPMKISPMRERISLAHRAR